MIIKQDDKECFTACLKALKNKEVIILPTDTIYGFSGIVPYAAEKILEIKKRPKDKKMIQLIAKPEDIYKYTDQHIPDTFFKLWPAPLTLIVKSKSHSDTIAFRCPDNKFLRELIEQLAVPIYSSSVNISGSEALNTVKDIAKVFEKKVKLIVDAGEIRALASTVVDLSLDEPMILRRGSLEL